METKLYDYHGLLITDKIIAWPQTVVYGNGAKLFQYSMGHIQIKSKKLLVLYEKKMPSRFFWKFTAWLCAANALLRLLLDDPQAIIWGISFIVSLFMFNKEHKIWVRIISVTDGLTKNTIYGESVSESDIMNFNAAREKWGQICEYDKIKTALEIAVADASKSNY